MFLPDYQNLQKAARNIEEGKFPEILRISNQINTSENYIK
mgnify:CR=1 FL=1